jgi:ubiquinone/menaquinone biosynthesis C-methylase UbiE
MGRRWLLRLYDPFSRFAGVARAHDQLLDRADIRPGQEILEIGTGTGNLLLALARRRLDVRLTGIDPDPDALRRARRKADRARLPIRFDRAYAGELPLPSASVDRVLSSFMLHHLDDEETARAAAEIRRVLRPGGQLHVVDAAGSSHEHGLGARLARRHPRLAGDLVSRVTAVLRDAGLHDVAENGRGSSRFGAYVFYRAQRSPAEAGDH